MSLNQSNPEKGAEKRVNWSKIIQACRRGDRYGQEQLYQHTADFMMNICIRYTPDSHTAQDVFQDSYLKVFERIHQYREKRGPLEAWMARIAINTALAGRRRQKKFQTMDIIPREYEDTNREDIIARLTAEEIQKCVQRLPEGFRIIFNLFVVEGFSHREISKWLKISPSTSRSQLARARVQLQKIVLDLQKTTKHEE